MRSIYGITEKNNSGKHTIDTVNRKPPRPTGLLYDDRMALHKHEWSSNEQENPTRIQHAFRRCQEEGLVIRCFMVPPRRIPEETLSLVHSRKYINQVKQTKHFSCQQLYEFSGQFDGVFFNQNTWDSACLAAGSLKHLANLVVQGRLSNGIALLRPPGHHAMHSEACGYCVFNNVAIVAASFLESPPVSFSRTENASLSNTPLSSLKDTSAQQASSSTSTNDGECYSGSNVKPALDRILIIDWDVHHGQGTQYTFYNDPRVLFISIHRYEHAKFWPNLREANFDFIGQGQGLGYNVNIPLEETGLTDSDYLAIFHHLIMPIAMEFNPQLVLVSCGFDAAIGCPEGRMWLSPAVYGHFIHYLKILAGGKLVVALEGGYYVDSLAEGVVHVVKSLLGDPPTPLRLTRPPCKSTRRTIDNCVVALRAHWKSLWMQDISKTMDRPDLTHLPVNSWPIVRRVVWPETNPLLPDELRSQVRLLMDKFLPVPTPPPTHMSTLFLAPSSYHVSMEQSQLIVALKGLFHVHLYCDESPKLNQSSKKRPYSSSPHYNSSCSATKRSRTVTASSSLYSTPTNSITIKRESHSAYSSPNCGCSFATIGNPLSKRMHTNAPDVKTALSQSINDLFLRKFSRALIIAPETLIHEVVDLVFDLPVSLLRAFRLSVTRTRSGKPPSAGMESTPQSPINISLQANSNTSQHRALHFNRGLSPMSMFSERSDHLFVPSVNLVTNNGVPVCRLLVLDFGGAQQRPLASLLPNRRYRSTSGRMQIDILWCSLYHGEFAEMLANSQQNNLRMISSKSHKQPIRHYGWFRLPVVNPSSTAPDEFIANVLALAFHILLPLAYEFCPDLVCFQSGKDWSQHSGKNVDVALAQLVQLFGTLGVPLLFCHVIGQPLSTSLINSLLNRSNQTENAASRPVIPSLRMQSVIREIMLANAARWKNLRFAGSVPFWRE